MQIKHFFTLSILCLVLLMQQGCLVVKDFGAYWAKAGVDSELVGQWYKDTNKPIIIVREDDHMVYFDAEESAENGKTEIKSLKVSDFKFLLLQNKVSKALFYYKVNNDSLEIYAPNKSRRKDFIADQFNDNLTINSGSVIVHELDDEVVMDIVNSVKAGLWSPVAKFRRSFLESLPVKSIHKSSDK